MVVGSPCYLVVLHLRVYSDDDCASTSSALSVGSRSTSPRPDLDGEGGGGSGVVDQEVDYHQLCE